MCVVNSITVDTSSFAASTAQGITKVLYGYVPSTALLRSVSTVALTVNIKSAAQLAIFAISDDCELKEFENFRLHR
jgi:hypothetical protein